jgi:hypothetical protein
MKPHKHAELIKQWADGAEIEIRTQYSDYTWSNWETFKNPNWGISNSEYRIKPEPKPDVDVKEHIALLYLENEKATIVGHALRKPNVMFTFDGETGNLKSAEVLK